jgi:hypothetical protein
VGDAVGVNASQILKWLNWSGVPIRGGGKTLKFTDVEEKEILRLHQREWQSRRAIAKRFGVAIETIGRVILRQIAKMTAEAKDNDQGTGKIVDEGSVTAADQATNGIVSGGATV